MNIPEYISSGIVESYVLGLADPEERTAFEQMCAEHAEVRAARDAFEIMLEKQASAGAVTPPEHVRSEIFALLENDLKAAPVIPFATKTVNSKNGGLSRYLAAASIVLLVVSTALNFYFFRLYKNYSERYADLLASQERVASENAALRQTLDSYKLNLQKVQDPVMVKVDLQGKNVPTSPQPSSLVTVYWDTRTKDVYVGAINLPKPATNRQYQLWAIVNGKPVDAGVFNIGDDVTLKKLRTIENPQAFAITLEKAGGSVTPTMTQMYVLGNVKTT